MSDLSCDDLKFVVSNLHPGKSVRFEVRTVAGKTSEAFSESVTLWDNPGELSA